MRNASNATISTTAATNRNPIIDSPRCARASYPVLMAALLGGAVTGSRCRPA